MISVWSDYNTRIEEINTYFNYLQDYSTESDDLFKILKANGYLLLYSLVESTVRNALEEIHSTFSNESLKYDELIDEIKALWIDFNYRKFKDKNAFDIASEINNIGMTTVEIAFSDYIEKIKSGDISGNLDRRKIEGLAQKYKFSKNQRVSGPELFIIKNNRNRLAHGEISFKDLGKAYNKNDMARTKKVCILYLKEMLLHIEKYLNDKKYKK